MTKKPTSGRDGAGKVHPASSRITPTKTVGPDFPGARTPVGTLVRFSTRKAAFTGRVMELREETARVGTGAFPISRSSV